MKLLQFVVILGLGWSSWFDFRQLNIYYKKYSGDCCKLLYHNDPKFIDPNVYIKYHTWEQNNRTQELEIQSHFTIYIFLITIYNTALVSTICHWPIVWENSTRSGCAPPPLNSTLWFSCENGRLWAFLSVVKYRATW